LASLWFGEIQDGCQDGRQNELFYENGQTFEIDVLISVYHSKNQSLLLINYLIYFWHHSALNEIQDGH